MTGDQHASIIPGNTSTFTVYVLGEEPVTLENVSAPDTWRVTTTPTRLPAENASYRYIRSGEGYEKAFAATITVQLPDTARAGTYDVTVIAATDRSRTADTITVRQIQPITFTVEVPGGNTVPTPSDGGVATDPDPAGSPEPRTRTPSLLYALLILEAIWLAVILLRHR